MEGRRLTQNDGALFERAIGEVLLSEEDYCSSASPTHLARALADHDCYFLVGLLGSEPIGYLSAYRFPDVEHDGFLVYLYDIVVRVDQRRRGVARRLIEALREYSRTEGVSRIWVGTSLENHAAARAFEATGATRESETYIEFTYALAGGGPAV